MREEISSDLEENGKGTMPIRAQENRNRTRDWDSRCSLNPVARDGDRSPASGARGGVEREGRI
jgi:hypothetical protein